MTPSQQVREFCKRNGLHISPMGLDRVVTVSKKFPAGAMWIECFDNWKQAQEYFQSGEIGYRDSGKNKPWSTPNYK